MKIVRALAQFVTSEVLLPATIVCLCALIASQLLPLVASSLQGEFEKRITLSGTITTTTLADGHTPKHEAQP